MLIKIIIIYFAVINFLGFLIMGYDKYKAVKNGWRIEERTLLTISFIGGALGMMLGMKTFHHKTRKPKFQIGVPLLAVLNTALYIYLYTKVS